LFCGSNTKREARRVTGSETDWSTPSRLRGRTLPHKKRIPVFDETRSAIKKPVLLHEGNSCRIVDADSLAENENAGREIIVRWRMPEQIPVITWLNPQRSIQTDTRTRRTTRTVRSAIRISSAPGMRGGKSAKADVRLIEKFASGDYGARRVIRSRKSARLVGGVPHEVFMRTAERSVLFFPGQGKRTGISNNLLEATFVRRTFDGWESKDANGWTLITETEARNLIRSGARKIGPDKKGEI
jgi:hypothetical protein